MKDQKQLKDEFKTILEKEVWPKSPKMVDYCVKKAAYIVELDNGDFMEIDKPSIETDFCFGYGMYGVSTDEDYKGAESMRNYAKTNENYFLQENLKGIDGMIKQLEGDDLTAYKRLHYYGQKEGSKLKSINFCRYWESPENGWERLTDAEKKAIVEGCKIVRAQFEKRLHTYLKKYGTSKLHTWTYLVD